MITVYVLESKESGQRYTGITNNIERRLAEHGTRATKAGQLLGEFSLIHTEEHADYATARAREKFLKSGRGRERLLSKYPRFVRSAGT